MLFLMVLLLAYAVTWALPRHWAAGRDRWRMAMAGAMAVAGVMHLVQPAPFVQHLPTWVPERDLLVLLSGLAEIGLGLALLGPRAVRRTAGVLLGLFLVAVFPANIYVAAAGIDVEGQPGGIYPWLRLALQPLFVWLAVWSTRGGPANHPFRGRRGGRVDRPPVDVEVAA